MRARDTKRIIAAALFALSAGLLTAYFNPTRVDAEVRAEASALHASADAVMQL